MRVWQQFIAALIATCGISTTAFAVDGQSGTVPAASEPPFGIFYLLGVSLIGFAVVARRRSSHVPATGQESGKAG